MTNIMTMVADPVNAARPARAAICAAGPGFAPELWETRGMKAAPGLPDEPMRRVTRE